MEEDHGETGLGWEASLPARLQAAGDAARASGFDSTFNEHLLRVLTTPEEQGSPDEPEARGRQRLEAKVDLLLATLSRQEDGEVPLHDLVLHAGGIRLDPGTPAPAGSHWRISLWLTANQPYPLTLILEATGEPDESGRTFFRFEGLSAEESDLLERFIFQQHRRAVAAARRGRDGVD